jgi:hypothetical protein
MVSPAYQEFAHLSSGVFIWSKQNFEIFDVNPPLPKMVASLPIVILKCNVPQLPPKRHHQRVEQDVAWLFITNNLDLHIKYLKISRLFCFFSIAALILFFTFFCLDMVFSAKIFFCVLFFTSPYIIAHGTLVSPDVFSAVFAIVSVYFFERWLKCPEILDGTIAGIVLGLAALTKFTLLIFYPLFIAMWILYRLPEIKTITKKDWFQQLKQIIVLFVVSVVVINMGYYFNGSGKLLGTFRFQTTLLTGCKTPDDVPRGGGNRFVKTPLAYFPMPLPSNFIQGIDTQRLDFERGLESYLRGEWSEHGWWYYYLYALLIKTPLGVIGLFLLAIFCTFLQKGYTIAWRDEMIILLPGIILFVFVSSQTGFSVHSRYIIPALPFFFVWTSKVGRAFSLKRPIVATIASILLVWSVFSSLSIYPHSLSYFNELAAILPMPEDKNYPQPPPEISKMTWQKKTFLQKTKHILTSGSRNGARHLLDSNIDWGQDLFNLEYWYKSHPEASNMKIAYWGSYPLGLTELPSKEKNINYNDLQPGWYALSVNYIYGVEQYRFFFNFEPVAMAGYSIYIYHITQNDINKLHQKTK